MSTDRIHVEHAMTDRDDAGRAHAPSADCRVLVVIVNYRTAKMVEDCLETLVAEIDATRDRVIVVDNESPDDSVDVLSRVIERRNWAGWASVVPAGRNGGFAAGNNVAIERRSADFYWLLNPDTLVKPRAMHELLSFLQAHPEVGIVGSKLIDAHGEPESTARRTPRPIDEFHRSAMTGFLSRLLGYRDFATPADAAPRSCDWVSGASMMVRREVFDQIGLMDDGYFLYFEELDFCERARAGGWEVWSHPASEVVHLEGASTGVNATVRKPKYWYDSRRRFLLRRFGVFGLLAADCWWLIGRATFRIRQLTFFLRRPNTVPAGMTWDIVSGDCRALFSGRAWAIAREASGAFSQTPAPAGRRSGSGSTR